MIKKLVKHGNSLALVIDKPILELMNITASTQLEIIADGKDLKLSPLRDPRSHQKLQDSIKKADKLYSSLFKDLAG